MAVGANAEGRCGNPAHKKGCPAHKPTVGGKPFVFLDHKKELEDLGLTSYQQALADDNKAGKKPPGQPTIVDGQAVYPARHFG